MPLVAATGPALATSSDHTGSKKRFMSGSVIVPVTSLGLLYFIRERDWLGAVALWAHQPKSRGLLGRRALAPLGLG